MRRGITPTASYVRQGIASLLRFLLFDRRVPLDEVHSDERSQRNQYAHDGLARQHTRTADMGAE